MSFVGELAPSSSVPFFITVNDKRGLTLFSGLASTPSNDEESKKTSMVLKDFTTLFNSEVVVDWGAFNGAFVHEFLLYALRSWIDSYDIGISGIVFDMHNIEGIPIDTELTPVTDIKENMFLKDFIFGILSVYDLYIESSIDVMLKRLTFLFKRGSSKRISIRLSDFGLRSFEKSFGDFNRAIVYDSDLSVVQSWALTEDNQIVRLPSEKDLVYPAKARSYIKGSEDSLQSTVLEAVIALSKNRFQESIDLNASTFRSVIDLTAEGFGTTVTVYTEDGIYGDIPIGEIETSSNGTHIVRLGRRVQELTQEV
jgi:hypothetical protein